MSLALTSVLWRHGNNSATFSAADLPLTIGTVSAADIRISGPGGQSLAQIDLVDGTPFVQPLLRPSPLTLNGEPLAKTHSLSGGQQLAAFGVTLDVTVDRDVLVVTQNASASAFETAPPIIAQTEDDETPLSAAQWQPSVAVKRKSNRRPVAIASIVVVLALLAGVIGWITTAVPVRLETIPAQPSVVAIDGPGTPVFVGGRYLLRKGVQTFTLQTPGYVDFTRRVDIDGSRTALVFEQQPLPGVLVVSLSGDAADAQGTAAVLTSDGSRYEAALPAQFDGLLPGRYDVEVSAAGFVGFSGSVDVAGLAQTQQLAISMVRDSSVVQVSTNPPGATVIALASNQTLADATPATITLPAGRQRVRYQLDGYKPVERTYEVFANAQDVASSITLEPADATLRVTSRPVGASVTLNGNYGGRTPLTLALEPGKNYDVRLATPGYASATRRVSLSSGQRRNLDVRLDARLGEVTVRTVPVDAQILINGAPAGIGTLTVDLPAEPQRITVRKKGFVDWQQTVTPRPGFSQTLDATLQTPEQIAQAAIKQTITGANSHNFQYVRAGTFKQGSSRREASRRANEKLHDVRLTKPFYIGTHEVTNAQFSAFRENHDRGGRVYPSIAGDDNPVVNVSWQDAAAYCNWLSDQDGLRPAYVGEFGSLTPVSTPTNGYRLPTEAQWVWVARYEGAQNAPRRYGWGADMPPPEASANIGDDSADDLLSNVLYGYRDGYPATAPVGSFPANALGVFDIDGNVAEWVQDFYAVSPASDGPQIDPMGPDGGPDHVIRGPGWRDANAGRLRLAYRAFGQDADIQTGFRVVKPAP
ncbi:MAG: PEGA domain-containing protein [Pseudomonadota bacterium]